MQHSFVGDVLFAGSIGRTDFPQGDHAQLIHSITSYTGEMSWSSRTPSAWITLEAGRRYFVEFLHSEGGGGDHAAFTWQIEGDPVPTNGTGLIPAGNLQYITGGNAPAQRVI